MSYSKDNSVHTSVTTTQTDSDNSFGEARPEEEEPTGVRPPSSVPPLYGTIPPAPNSVFERIDSEAPSHFPPNSGPYTIPAAKQSQAPTHDYEPLVGGTGKEIYYRQARNSISDLLDNREDIQHSVHFDGRVGTIVNYGINGVAFSTNDEAPAKDDFIDTLGITIGQSIVYKGRASVRYSRAASKSMTTVGVVLLDGILDVDAMVMAKNRALAISTAVSLGKTLESGVSQQYKESMADLVLLLSCYRELLNGQEKSFQSLSTRSARERAEHELLNGAISDFGPKYDIYRRRCNVLTLGLTGTAKRAYRQYTEALLHPYVLSAPLVHHCFRKPLGYPGDYMLMSYLYDPAPYGNSLYDKMIHQVVVRDEPMAFGVVKRKDFLLHQICEAVSASRSSADMTCRILSLACGPAQEVLEFVTAESHSATPVVFTLLDQDQRSLTHVNSTLSKLLIPGTTSISVKYLYLGFMQMIAELDAFDALPEQHLIYTAGLFDYIRIASAQQLAQRLFQKLKRGGKLEIVNFKHPNDSTWGLEYLVDWHLIYRTREDMLAIAELIDEPHSIELTSDISGQTHVLVITRT